MLKKTIILSSLLFTISCGQEQPVAETQQFETQTLNYIESAECEFNSHCSIDKMCNPFTNRCIPLSHPSCRADTACQGSEVCLGLQNIESVGKCSQPAQEPVEEEQVEEEQPEQEPVEEEEQPEQEPVEEEELEEEQPEQEPVEEEELEEEQPEQEPVEEEELEEEQPEQEPVTEEEETGFSGECELEGNIYNFQSSCLHPFACLSRHQDNFQVVPETGFCGKICFGDTNCPGDTQCVLNGVTPGVGYCER
jgi:hypothetical protein